MQRREAAVVPLAILFSVLTGLGITAAPAVTLSLAVAAVLVIVILMSDSVVVDHLVFIALLSGPPRIRARDPLASLQGQMDWVVVLHVIVWLAGAVWVFREVFKNRNTGEKGSHILLRWPHYAGLLLVFLLGLSMAVSPGPLLTGFRVFQILVMVLFGFFWVERHGVQRTLHILFWGYAILGAVLVVAAVVSPDLVLAGKRMRGDLIADTGAVGAAGLIALLSFSPSLRRWVFVPALLLFSSLLIFSLTRSAYASVLLFLLLSLMRRPRISALRGFLVFVGLLVLVLIVSQLLPLVVNWIIRDPRSLATLSARLPWWKFLVPIMLNQSPWIGLGFYAAPRVYGLTYTISIGTAHNALIEVLVGGGVPSGLLFLLIVLGTLLTSFKMFLSTGKSPEVFATFMLLLAVLSVGIVSEEMIIASPTAVTFWLVVAAIQKLRAQPVTAATVERILPLV
jgi:O-antigen ligase